MAFQSFLDMFQLGTGGVGSTIVRTGYGFTPKACLYWCTGKTTGGPLFSRATLLPSFGMATSPTSRACVNAFSYDAQGTMVTNRRHSNADIIAQMAISPTLNITNGVADLQSFDSASGGGQTLVIDEAFTLDIRIHCLALGGDDLTDVALVQFQQQAATGIQSITSLSFQPTAVLFMGTGHNAAAPAIATEASLCFGMATGASAQGSVTLNDQDAAVSSVTGSYGYGGECVTWLDTSTTVGNRGAFSSFLSNGFQINWLETMGTAYSQYWALCLRGGSFLVGDFVTSTTLNATIVESGFGFAPTGCLLLSHSKAQSTQDTPTSQANLSLGAFTSPTNRACQSIVSNNAANSAICASSLNEDACLRMLNSGTVSAGVVDVQAVGNVGDDSFTLIMDAADVTTAKYVTYLAFGDTPPAPGARTPPVVTDLGESAWTGATTSLTRATANMTVQAGDVVVAMVLCDAATAIGTLAFSGGTLAWTTRQDVGTSPQARVAIATAVVDVNKSMTVTATRSLATSTYWGVCAFVFRGVSGIGMHYAQAASSTGVPSLAVTMRASNSAIMMAIADQNGIDVSTRAFLTGAGSFTEFVGNQSTGAFSAVGGYYPNTGTAGASTIGESAPTGQMWALGALELYGPLAAPPVGGPLLPQMMHNHAG